MKTLVFVFTFFFYYLTLCAFVWVICPSCGFRAIGSWNTMILFGGATSFICTILSVLELSEKGKI